MNKEDFSFLIYAVILVVAVVVIVRMLLPHNIEEWCGMETFNVDGCCILIGEKIFEHPTNIRFTKHDLLNFDQDGISYVYHGNFVISMIKHEEEI